MPAGKKSSDEIKMVTSSEKVLGSFLLFGIVVFMVGVVSAGCGGVVDCSLLGGEASCGEVGCSWVDEGSCGGANYCSVTKHCKYYGFTNTCDSGVLYVKDNYGCVAEASCSGVLDASTCGDWAHGIGGAWGDCAWSANYKCVAPSSDGCDGFGNEDVCVAAGCDWTSEGVDDVDEDDDGYNEDVDCDDGDAGVNPGAEEVCGDGIDNDCDGVSEECAPNDLIAPESISNLEVEARSMSSIKWTWSNPSDLDFFENLVYVDGVNVANTSDNFYRLNDLDTWEVYEITVYTVDESGNVNWSGVSDDAETLGDGGDSPSISGRVVIPRSGSSSRDVSVSNLEVVSGDDFSVIYLGGDEVRASDSGISVFVWMLVVGILLLIVAIGLVFVL